MGLLDSALGAVTGGGGANSNALAGALQSVLAGKGGLSGLGELFNQKGLASMFAGWVSTGPNPPITGDQLSGVLGPDTVSQLSSKLGVDGAQTSNILANFLPAVVDKLTPNGRIEPTANVEQSLASVLPGLLQGGLGSLLGGLKR